MNTNNKNGQTYQNWNDSDDSDNSGEKLNHLIQSKRTEYHILYINNMFYFFLGLLITSAFVFCITKYMTLCVLILLIFIFIIYYKENIKEYLINLCMYLKI